MSGAGCPCCGQADHAAPVGAPPPCPGCGGAGERVEWVTPRHTLLAALRPMATAARRYAFCPAPACATVYYTDDGRQRFTVDDLIHPVTCKSAAADTPLCYCFKESKGAVRAELAARGRSGVVARIEERMAERGCFCEKSNPRGVCCLAEIDGWLRRPES